jgi:putative nucleotidyltransferase with HDIG domain
MRIESARKILRDLNGSYEILLRREEEFSPWLYSEHQSYCKSHLLYFIAVTEDNEDTIGHSKFVASYTLLLAKALGMEKESFLRDIERGALLHDIGKIGIPETILRKPGSLTCFEKEIVKEHPVLGYNIIEEFDFLRNASDIVLYHHEHFDGSGYPFGLIGEEIPLGARIFSLADTMDAITSDRTYRKGRNFYEALIEIEKCRGSQFDSSLVDVMLSVSPRHWELARENAKTMFRLPTIH